MRPFALLILVATSVTICARALPKDDSINARDAIPDADVPAINARAAEPTATTTSAATTAQVTLSASTSAATKEAHKSKHGSATALSGVATSTAKPKGAKGKHTGKGHHNHHAACNSTLATSNSTNSASNSTIGASNCTLTSSNSTLTSSNSTLAASNITGAAVASSNVNAPATTKTSTAEKKTGAKVAGTANARPTAQPSANDLNNIIEELTSLSLSNVARDLPRREAKGESSFSHTDEYKW